MKTHNLGNILSIFGLGFIYFSPFGLWVRKGEGLSSIDL